MIDADELRSHSVERCLTPSRSGFLPGRNHHQASRSDQRHKKLAGLRRGAQEPGDREIMRLPPFALVTQILSPSMMDRHSVLDPSSLHARPGEVASPLAGIDETPAHLRHGQSQ